MGSIWAWRPTASTYLQVLLKMFHHCHFLEEAAKCQRRQDSGLRHFSKMSCAGDEGMREDVVLSLVLRGCVTSSCSLYLSEPCFFTCKMSRMVKTHPSVVFQSLGFQFSVSFLVFQKGEGKSGECLVQSSESENPEPKCPLYYFLAELMASVKNGDIPPSSQGDDRRCHKCQWLK